MKESIEVKGEQIAYMSCGRLDKDDLLTYSRHKTQTEQITHVQPSQSTSLDLAPMSSNILIGNENLIVALVVDDTDVPIAIRNGVRTCTRHPGFKFVSYNSLSPSFCAFVSFLPCVSILQGWVEAITNSKSKEAMVEELKALGNNETWELISLQLGKKKTSRMQMGCHC